MAGYSEPSLDSWRTGLLLLAVALISGFVTARLVRQRGDDDAEPLNLARPAMGTVVEVSVPATDDPDAHQAAARAVQAALAEVTRVDSLFSWRLPPPVQTAPTERQRERRRLLELGFEVLRTSGGAFDPRVLPLVKAWGFDGDEPRVPAATELEKLVAGLRQLGMPHDAAELESQSDRLHYGAWAKGYAVDRALITLQAYGEAAGLVNAGGEVRGYGRDWVVGVQHPRLPGALLARLAPGEMAVATSGDYEQYFERDGRRYHHLLDPRDGWPATGCRSVTIVARSCARADALATAVFVLGPAEGMDLVERLADVESLIIDDAGQRHDSSGLVNYLAED